MSTESGGPASGGNKSSENKCKYCSKFVSNDVIRCSYSECNTLIHPKCFDNLNKIVKIDIGEFKCRYCPDTKNMTSIETELVIVKKEVECLMRERDLLLKYVSELEYNAGLLKENFKVGNAPCLSYSAVAAGTKKRLTSIIGSERSVNKYVNTSGTEATTVLLVRSSDGNSTNKDVEHVVKAQLLKVDCSKPLEKLGSRLTSRVGNRNRAQIAAHLSFLAGNLPFL
ncbi:hypothetical protein WA026_004324 [Henosepilachna vigintioctopunctata]|uniref:PHD-type domain-containing protein n=1 Tax=Henosepilachna vigintioctopunctata TaxID=420089 RepID=A0AAW1V1T4_9CUCU